MTRWRRASAPCPGAVLTKAAPVHVSEKGRLARRLLHGSSVAGSYDREQLRRTLVVGDAGADILAAHDGGMDFWPC